MAEFVPLTEKELSMLPEAVRLIYADIAVGCTSCRYCMDGCPKAIDIPKLFELYNAEMRAPDSEAEARRNRYEALTDPNKKASDCIRCRKCEKSCPQHIKITTALKKVAETFEENR